MNISREQFKNMKSLPMFKGKIVSDSMSPLIKIGDEILVDVGTRDLKRFDIIVIFIEGKLVCHYLWRINRIVKPVLLQTRSMKGLYDFPVPEEDYLGKVISHRIGFWKKLRILL